MASAVDAYIQQNEPRFLDELLEFLRIPSISTLPEHKADVARAAQFVADSLKRAGLENVGIIQTNGHPLVYADWLHAPGKPTVLCYGHYDVQPPDPVELWKSPPFEPSIRDGNIYARGACDDKGQMYMHVKAVEALRTTDGTLPLNVKFLIEGEEEVGGESISEYVPNHREKLKSNVALVSDTELFADGVPTLCIGLRGLIYLEIEAKGPARDLHSGMYGGTAPNAVYGLIELLAKAKDADGRIQIPGIYDDVIPPDPAEVKSWKDLPFSEQDFLRHEVGATQLTGEPEQSVLARIWARPTFEVHGIAGGFTGAGAKTVIPARAVAKVSLRLVPDQKPDRVLDAVKQWVKDSTPKGIQTEIRVLSAGPAISVNPADPAIRIAARVFSEQLGKPTVFIRSGGSIPIVGEFAKHLRIPTVLMGFGLPDDGLHSPNEKYRVSNYYQGIKTIARFLEEYGGQNLM
ncbi:MAG TPA: dipeptidase [Bryobacteraceae bacterium]|jgi:acetylornithine deacetylase/succinyl-diaminopimelate desuccinylase-like protein